MKIVTTKDVSYDDWTIPKDTTLEVIGTWNTNVIVSYPSSGEVYLLKGEWKEIKP